MKPCTEVRHLLLEAEPHELEGEGASPVSIHVRSCPSCRLAARRVLEQTATLHAYLTPDPSALDVEALLRRAAALPPPDRETDEHPRPVALPMRVPRRWAALAAAAVIAALLLLPGERTPYEAPPITVRTARLPTVEASAGQSVAVMETSNPDITVLWFF